MVSDAGKYPSCPSHTTRIDSAIACLLLSTHELSNLGYVASFPLRSNPERAHNDEKFRVISEFITVYGIGPVVGSKLYAEGHRSLEDLKARFVNSKVNVGIGREAYFPMEEALRLRDELQIK